MQPLSNSAPCAASVASPTAAMHSTASLPVPIVPSDPSDDHVRPTLMLQASPSKASPKASPTAGRKLPSFLTKGAAGVANRSKGGAKPKDPSKSAAKAQESVVNRAKLKHPPLGVGNAAPALVTDAYPVHLHPANLKGFITEAKSLV